MSDLNLSNTEFLNYSNMIEKLISQTQIYDDSSSDEDENQVDNKINKCEDENDALFSAVTWMKLLNYKAAPSILIPIPDKIVEWFRKGDLSDISTCPKDDEFIEEITGSIKDLGGTVFFKNNWRAPTDAKMFSLNRLLQSKSYEDIIYIMSLSTRMLTDFEKHLENHKFHIQLRKWMDIHPACEYRGIVVHKRLMGVTPRDWPAYNEQNTRPMNIINEMKDLYDTDIRNRIPMDHFVFDVHLTLGKPAILWDISPLNETTELHAYMWDEINKLVQDPPPEPGVSPNVVFRYIDNEKLGICLKYELAYN